MTKTFYSFKRIKPLHVPSIIIILNYAENLIMKNIMLLKIVVPVKLLLVIMNLKIHKITLVNTMLSTQISAINMIPKISVQQIVMNVIKNVKTKLIKTQIHRI